MVLNADYLHEAGMSMLNKKDILDMVIAKQFPKNEYWITAGAGLVMHGLKSETRDIDIGCSTLLADRLIQKGAKWQFLANGTRKIEIDSSIEAFENWHVDCIIEIDGLCVASLGSIRKQKVNLNREKDWADIRLIDEFAETE